MRWLRELISVRLSWTLARRAVVSVVQPRSHVIFCVGSGLLFAGVSQS